MIDLLSRANVRAALWLNHYLADQTALYRFVLEYQEAITGVAMLATLLLLWFWPQMTRASYMPPLATPREGFGDELAEQVDDRPLLRRLRARQSPIRPVLTRHDSRAQFLVLGLSAMLAYLLAQIIAVDLDVARPFMSYWPVRSPIGIAFEGYRLYGSFPSDTAVLLAALPIALLRWDKRLALAWAVLAVLLGLAQVGLGFRYPADVIGGALLGWLFVGGAFAIYEARGKFYIFFTALARAFDRENTPYNIYLYGILLVMAIEFALRMDHIRNLIFQLSDAVMFRFR